MTDPDRGDGVEHRVEHTRELAATPEQVWDAIATADGISAWMVPVRLDPPGGLRGVVRSRGFRSTGVVTDYTPNRRLAYEKPWPMTEEMREWVADTSGHEVTDEELASVSPIATEFVIEAASGGSCILRAGARSRSAPTLDGRVLVDTGMTELHPAVVAAFDPRLHPVSEQDVDVASIDIVVNTHLHADHCGGNHLFPGRPIYVQRRELDDARGEEDYTIREWVDAPGLQYVPVDGELEILPGVRLVPTPGHTPGSQVVVVTTGGRPDVVCGDTAVWFGELDEPRTEGQRRIRALDPERVWLAHVHEPWRRPGATRT